MPRVLISTLHGGECSASRFFRFVPKEYSSEFSIYDAWWAQVPVQTLQGNRTTIPWLFNCRILTAAYTLSLVKHIYSCTGPDTDLENTVDLCIQFADILYTK